MSEQLKPRLKNSLISSQSYRQWIYLLDGNHQETNELMNSLYNNGYQVRRFEHVPEVCKACQKKMPLALLYVADSFPGASSADEIVKAFEQWQMACPPLIYISTRKDMKARLAAAKVGALRYFSRPVNLAKLNNTLGRLNQQFQPAPPRILFVDDDENLLVLYKSYLKKQGMDVMLLSDPMQTLQTFEDFRPDLVLLDVNMPQCSGLELARIIRQDDDYMYIPIIFLSEAAEQEYQLDAVLFGGDVFIQKSIQPNQLAELMLAVSGESVTLTE